MRRRFDRTTTVAVLLALGLGAAASRAQDQPPTAAGVATALGFDAAAIRRAQAGEVVSRSIQESSGREIGAVVAMIVKAPVSRVRTRILSKGTADLDPAVLSTGRIQLPATAASFAALRIPPAELARLAEAAPGSDLNLSTEEIAALRAAAPNGQAAVGDAYRGLLAARVEAYRARGLAGIAPYARARGTNTSAADALRVALEAETAVRRLAPHFYDALAAYPAALPAGYEDQFSWALVDVQGRPTVVLIHRLAGTRGDATGVAERHFYASQGFNALQIVIGLFPVTEGTAVLYTNRTNTDQVATFGRMAQSIGRRMLVAEVTQFFQAAQRAARD